MDANKRVAPAGATHHGRVLIDHHVAHSSAQDSGIEHDEHPKVTVHALQRDAEKDVQDHIHQHVDEANMGELVGEPPVDLRPVIFASRPYEAQVRAHILERVQAGLDIQEVFAIVSGLDARGDEPQERHKGALDDHEEWDDLTRPEVLHRNVLLSLSVHLRLDEVADADLPVAIAVEKVREAVVMVLVVLRLLLSRGGALGLGGLAPLIRPRGLLLRRVLRFLGTLHVLVEVAMVLKVGLDILRVEVAISVDVEARGAEPVGEEEDDVVDYIGHLRRLHLIILLRHGGFKQGRLAAWPQERVLARERTA
mmetsp:Transcript_117393/g.328630  ORF Transcript_117393/g.328630 Transcript_117393/m.328630 type:complete len:309 (+) Transcript_117393:823-1749(+)